MCSTLAHLSSFPIDMFARSSHPAHPVSRQGLRIGRSCLEVSKVKALKRRSNTWVLTCSMGGYRHLVVEAASWCGLCGWFTWGSLLSKAPEVVWCCLNIFNSILTNLNSHELDSPPMHPMTSFTHVFLDDGMDHGFLLLLRSFMVPQSIGLEILSLKISGPGHFGLFAAAPSSEWTSTIGLSVPWTLKQSQLLSRMDSQDGSIDPHWSYLVYWWRDWFGSRLSPASLSEFLKWFWIGTLFFETFGGVPSRRNLKPQGHAGGRFVDIMGWKIGYSVNSQYVMLSLNVCTAQINSPAHPTWFFSISSTFTDHRHSKHIIACHSHNEICGDFQFRQKLPNYHRISSPQHERRCIASHWSRYALRLLDEGLSKMIPCRFWDSRKSIVVTKRTEDEGYCDVIGMLILIALRRRRTTCWRDLQDSTIWSE